MKKLSFDVHSSETYETHYVQRFDLCETDVSKILEALHQGEKSSISVEDIFDYFEGGEVATHVKLSNTQAVLDGLMEEIALYAIDNIEEYDDLEDWSENIEQLDVDKVTNIVVSKV